jgi:hypothetical protein
MNDIEKQDIRKAIERYEYYRNGLDRMSCSSVKVRNLKVRKTKPITADVTLCFGKGRREERYPNLEYTLHSMSAGTPNCI